jgi:hypothetical protein
MHRIFKKGSIVESWHPYDRSRIMNVETIILINQNLIPSILKHEVIEKVY